MAESETTAGPEHAQGSTEQPDESVPDLGAGTIAGTLASLLKNPIEAADKDRIVRAIAKLEDGFKKAQHAKNMAELRAALGMPSVSTGKEGASATDLIGIDETNISPVLTWIRAMTASGRSVTVSSPGSKAKQTKTTGAAAATDESSSKRPAPSPAPSPASDASADALVRDLLSRIGGLSQSSVHGGM
jgi:hypothetical protein